jgi:hypothetical protein
MEDEELRELKDRMEIHQVLMRYCRAIDRTDPELLATVYHEGAVDRHGPHEFKDAKHEFGPLVVENLDQLKDMTMHHITNYLIELDGDSAVAESYFLAIQPTPLDDGTEPLSFIGGRYLDHFERRDGRWAITDRTVVNDFSRLSLPGGEWPSMREYLVGGRREADPSHTLFKELLPRA